MSGARARPKFPQQDAFARKDMTSGPRPDSDDGIKLLAGDCREVLAKMDSDSIHLVVSDPPYFLDGLDDGWRKGRNVPKSNGAIGGLPIGMKFDRRQGERLQAFLEPIVAQLHRVLMPGAFMLLFSAPRLAHRMALAAENAGFEIRDQFAWRFRGKAQFKAFTQDHFVARRKDLREREKKAAIKKLAGRRTPQLRPQFEAIICAQKPKQGTFVDNWLAFETGLIDAKQTLNGSVPSTVMETDGNTPSTVMEVEKPAKASFNGHLTPKPVKLCSHLIRVFSAEGQIVLDPFVGSGTTCIAARDAGRRCTGIDINPEYIKIAQRRLTRSNKKGRTKVDVPEYVAKMDIPADNRWAITELAKRFQNRAFLPTFGDISDFCEVHEIEEPKSKSRASAVPRIFKFLATMDAQEIMRIVDDELYSGPTRLGPIADAIRENGRARGMKLE